MPLDRKDIEITKEVPSVLQKMERAKFYSFEELFEMEYGPSLIDSDDAEVRQVEWSQWTSLSAVLVALVEQGRLVTGVKKGEPPRIITLRKDGKVRKFPLAPKVYYGLP